MARLGKLWFSPGSIGVSEFAACEISTQRGLSTALFQPTSSSERNSGGNSSRSNPVQPSLGFAFRGFSGDGVTPDDDSATLKTYQEDIAFPEGNTSTVADSAGEVVRQHLYGQPWTSSHRIPACARPSSSVTHNPGALIAF